MRPIKTNLTLEAPSLETLLQQLLQPQQQLPGATTGTVLNPPTLSC